MCARASADAASTGACATAQMQQPCQCNVQRRWGWSCERRSCYHGQWHFEHRDRCNGDDRKSDSEDVVGKRMKFFISENGKNKISPNLDSGE